jgi:hypothetical protein
MARNPGHHFESETADSNNSVSIDFDYGLGKRLRRFLRQIVADPPGDNPASRSEDMCR